LHRACREFFRRDERAKRAKWHRVATADAGTAREHERGVQEQTHSPLSLDVCELLDSCIDSIEALDALLLLLRDPSRWWSLAELAREIDVSVDGARAALDALRARALASEAASSTLFRLAPLDSFAHAAFTSLARACSTERSAVVEHVSRRSMARFRVLAEAFTRVRTT
jgi:hypothetical protein